MQLDNLYSQDGIVVRSSTIEDVDYLCTRLRESDVHEVYASHHYSPFMALYLSLYKSVIALTVEDHGIPLAMFGLNPETIMGSRGVVWLLASTDLNYRKVRFVRHTKKFIKLMMTNYTFIYNFVHENNTESIEWLRRSGAVIYEPRPYGVEGENFRFFYFERGN